MVTMPFEIFSRKMIRTGAPSVTATKLGRLSLNKSATHYFEKNAVEFVLLLWDAELHKMAIRPIVKKDPRSYRVSYGVKGNGAGFSAKTFLDFIGLDYSESRAMPATWNSDQEILEVDVPVAFLAATQQKNLIEIENPNQKRSAAK
jgi:hypothetical protein